MSRSAEKNQVAALQDGVADEIFYALGFSRTSWPRRVFGPLFRLPTQRFAHIFALLDDEVARSGLSGGSRRGLPEFSMNVTARGAEHIPAQGPLLIASNHTGAYDSLAIMSCVPRQDLKIFVSDVPLLRALSAARQYLIYVPQEPDGRMAALRAGIQHLKDGGSLMIFANGQVEPDPELLPGASESIQGWSSSIEIMLRKVPDTLLQIVIASGVILRRFLLSPITKIRRASFDRQKLGEVLQVLQQMVSPRSVAANIHISFAPPVSVAELGGDRLMPAIIQKARRLLEEHMASLMGV